MSESTNVGAVPLDGNKTRRSVLATIGSVAGSGALVGTAAGQDADGEPSGTGGSDRSSDGRPRMTPTRVTEDGVSIDFQTCQVCHVTGDSDKVQYVDADFEYYDTARGETSHYRESYWDDLPLVIDARELGWGLPETAESPILGHVEVWDEDFMPLTSLAQPAQWECRTMLG